MTGVRRLRQAKFFFGAVGAGTRMKLVVNMVMGSMMCAFGEGISLCDAVGLDGAQLLQVTTPDTPTALETSPRVSRPERPPWVSRVALSNAP